jgi:hypothetical protein
MRGTIGSCGCEVIEVLIGNPYDMLFDKGRSLLGTLLGMFDTTLPLHDRPAGVIILCQLTEYRFEIYLAISGRTIPPCSIGPGLVPSKGALLSTGSKLSILYMKGPDAFVVMIDVLQIIQLL